MALSFPRIMPQRFAAEIEFELQRVDQLSPGAGGRLNAVTLGAPRWIGRWALGRLSPDKAEEVRAWIASLRGSQRTFLGADPRRLFPKAHPGGLSGGGFSTNGTRDVVSVSSGGTATVGDYIGFAWGGGDAGRALVRCVESGSFGSGVAVEPAVPTVVPGGALAYFNGPSCLMKLTPETNIGPSREFGAITGVVVGAQHLVA